jgi:outer membrane lipoprotein
MNANTLITSLPLVVIIALALHGCATTDCVGPTGHPTLTPAQVAAASGHTGELLRWGGTLVETANLADRTELTVIAYPLDRCGVPRLDQEPSGRFIASVPGYLETADYRPGRSLTVTGLLTGTREGLVGEAPYRFPVLSNAKVRWWSGADATRGGPWPWVSIGISGGSGGWYGGGVGGGIGVNF